MTITITHNDKEKPTLKAGAAFRDGPFLSHIIAKDLYGNLYRLTLWTSELTGGKIEEFDDGKGGEVILYPEKLPIDWQIPTSWKPVKLNITTEEL